MPAANPNLPSPVSESKTDFYDLLSVSFIFLLALFLRILYLEIVRPAYLSADLDRYIYIASAIGRHEWDEAIHYHYPPLFSLLIYLIGLLGATPEGAGNAIAIFFSSLTVLPIYLIGKSAANRRTAFFAGALFAITSFSYWFDAHPEQISIFLIFTSLWIFLRTPFSRSPARPVSIGALLGIGFLDKPETFAYLLLFLVLLFGGSIRRLRYAPGNEGGKRPRGMRPAGALYIKAFFHPLLCASIYFAVAGPYIYSYYRDTGTVSANPKGETLFVIHNALYPNLDLYKIFEDSKGYYTPAQRIYMEGDKIPLQLTPLDIIENNPGLMARTYFTRLYLSTKNIVALELLQSMVPYLWPLLLALGIKFHRKNAYESLAVHGVALVPLLLVPLFSHLFTRFFIGMLPWMALVMGRGFDRAIFPFERAIAGQQTRKPIYLAGGIVAILLCRCLIQIFTAPDTSAYWREIEFKRGLAKSLAQGLPGQCKFMAEMESPGMWYLAGLTPKRQVILPIASPTMAARYGRALGAKYLVLHKSRIQDRYRDLYPLLGGDYLSNDLTLLSRSQSPSGEPYAIYEIAGSHCDQ